MVKKKHKKICTPLVGAGGEAGELPLLSTLWGRLSVMMAYVRGKMKVAQNFDYFFPNVAALSLSLFFFVMHCVGAFFFLIFVFI